MKKVLRSIDVGYISFHSHQCSENQDEEICKFTRAVQFKEQFNNCSKAIQDKILFLMRLDK